MPESFIYSFIKICGYLFFCLCLICSAGCRKKPDDPDGKQSRVQTIKKMGYEVPVFATASDQLNYARTLLSKPDEKSAALNVLIDRFPDNREKKGEARLELAYMLLGSDFRLAGKSACKKALSAYEAIAREYKDTPSVFTKALWYMGWIHTDLLKEKHQGVTLYSALAEQYPEYSFSRISPVPWLELIFPHPDIKPYTADDKYIHFWADLALLEIVKNTDSEEKRMAAFNKLWEKHPESMATGYALKEILQHSSFPQKMAQVASTYIQLNRANPELNRDLESSVNQSVESKE